MASATPFLTTVNGATTAYVPLATAWPSAGPECAEGLYHQIGGNFMGWDPWYMYDVDTRLSTCWPPEASTWWTQAALPTTVLGPVFTCPEAYYEVYTSTLDSHTTQTLCCPSHYRLHVANFARPAFPSQCTSTLTAQQSLTWQDQFRISETDGSTWSLTPKSTVVPQGSTFTVYGWPVNGLNVVASSTASATSATGTGSSTVFETDAGSTSASIPDSSAAASSGSNSSSNLGVIIGATVGIVVGILLLVVGAFVLWRKRRARKGRGRQPARTQTMEDYRAVAMGQKTPTTLASELPVINYPTELNSLRNVQELPH
ncbi:hypothetical protein DHEL01_v212460 [Diaporthe helianthi]|uniref:LPXTG-domain-containing protein n=1 Tax=Diaporthe helianthi TaxID=158607 RepID=A0A2P5HFX1_DIAHE|nr:hypothetical protein DHEL01_v212460 [Diaporthe helianthi]